jgi:GDP-4-dehydro-6-deoxy-D-mannose reductase
LALAEPPRSGLEIVIARPFNLAGPGMGPQLSLGRFAREIVAATADRELRCGPLDARRDFVDVRDAAEAYVALAKLGRPGELYNVCSGRSFRIGDLLERLVELAGFRGRVVCESHPACPDGPKEVVGDPTKIKRTTGWLPMIAMDQSLADLLASAGLEVGADGKR